MSRGFFDHDFQDALGETESDFPMDAPARALGEALYPAVADSPTPPGHGFVSGTGPRRASRRPEAMEGAPRDSPPRIPAPPLAVPPKTGVDLVAAVEDRPCERAGDFTNEEANAA